MQEKVSRGEFQPTDSPLLPEIPYLMLLNPFDAENIFPEIPKGVYYSEITDPWLFAISDPAILRLVNSHSANPHFDFTLSLEQMVAYIEHPELIPPTATLIVEPTVVNPYPNP